MGYRRNIAFDRAAAKYRVRKEHHGRVFKRSFSTRRLAELYLEQLEAQFSGLNLVSSVPTLSEATEQYQTRLTRANRSPETHRYYHERHRAVIKGIGDVRLSDIDQRHIDRFEAMRREDGVSPGTINRDIASLTQLYKMVNLSPTWRYDPMAHDKQEKLVYSPAEIASVWQRLPDKARVPFALCLFAGLRAAEAFRAKASWIRRDQGELWIHSGRKTRDQMKTALVGSLAALLPRRDPIVTLTKEGVYYHIKRACGAAGVTPGFTGPGLMRHHCATWGVDYSDGKFNHEDARLVLGHRIPGSTGRYVHSQVVGRKREFLELVESLANEVGIG